MMNQTESSQGALGSSCVPALCRVLGAEWERGSGGQQKGGLADGHPGVR